MSKIIGRALLAILGILGTSSGARSNEPLAALEPLVGDWVAEARTPDGKEIVRSISYRWIFDRKFFRADSERKVDDQSVRMTITYLYDAQARKIRAWIIASDGSWSQAEVEATHEAVRLDSKGVGADGTPLTLISTLRATVEGTRSETWANIQVGGRPQPSPPAIVWKRVNSKTTLTPASDSRDSTAIRTDREPVVKRHLRSALKGYEWFAHSMHGEPARRPSILMQTLPELAPDLWDRPEDRFTRFGFFDELDDTDRPLPLGPGWMLNPVDGDEVQRDFHTSNSRGLAKVAGSDPSTQCYNLVISP